MRKWAALSQKGGSGKSTLILHLAIAAMADGRVTSVIDLDPQKSAEKWSVLREQKTGNEDPVIVHGLPTRLAAMLESAKDTDLVLIDTPPIIDQTTIFAAAAADLIIVPTRTSILDEQALDDALATLGASHALPKAVVVLNAPGSDQKARASIINLARKRHRVPVLDAGLQDRLEFRKSLGVGKGVTELMPDSPAAKELAKLYKALCKWDARLAKRKIPVFA
jgi:chromosome partitioning protein